MRKTFYGSLTVLVALLPGSFNSSAALAAAPLQQCPDLAAAGTIVRDQRPGQLVKGLAGSDSEKPDRGQRLPSGRAGERLFKAALLQCLKASPTVGERTIGHRGAPLHYPEHTRESYLAAARLGAGTIECDVTFTKEGTLVCRHAACDLQRTTNILETPLAERCRSPFVPAVLDADGTLLEAASASCCTADLNDSEFLALRGRRDAINEAAQSVVEWYAADPQGAPAACLEQGTLMTHAQSIELFQQLGVAMAPELKAQQDTAPVSTPQQTDLADQLVHEYRVAGVPPGQVWLQSFEPEIVAYWLSTAGVYAERVVWLDGRYADPAFNHRDERRLQMDMVRMRALGLQNLAPPMWMLLENEGGVLRPSAYARLARAAGLRLITWTVERSGPLAEGGGWYYQTLNGSNPLSAYDGASWVVRDADQLLVLRALFDDVGVAAVFSDWPSTTALVDQCLEQFPIPLR